MTIVHLLRHGEVYNPDRVLYGRLPGFRLSDRGVEQAELAAKFLAARDISYLVSSPLERARQTAAPLAALTGLDVAVDERLIEAMNKLEGRQVAGGRGVLRDISNWKYYSNPFRPSWGEPYAEIAERVLAAAHAAAEAVEASGGREAVCVSHQLPIVAGRRRAEGRHLFHDPRKRQCSLASVTSLTIVDGVIVRIDYAEPAGATPKGAVAGA